MKRDLKYNQLFQAIVALNSVEECELFFDDLCTIAELQAMAQRLEVADMLSRDANYNEISTKTGASSATVSRVARCYNHGDGGYKLVLERLKGEKE